MSFSIETTRVAYTGNDSTNNYGYPWRISTTSDIKVIVLNTSGVETVLTLTTDYTVTGQIGDEANTKEITLVDDSQAWLTGGNLKQDYKLYILLYPSLKQETSIRNQGAFNASTHEDTFDIEAQKVLRIQDELDRCLKFPVSLPSSIIDPTLPTDSADNASYIIIINSTNDGIDVVPASDVVSLTGALAVANNLNDLNSVAGALVNLGIAPLSTPTTTTIDNSMSATTISGYSFSSSSYQWVVIEFFITRNSGAICGSGRVEMHYDGSAWDVLETEYNFDSSKASYHGLTWSVSSDEFQVASDGSGTGNLITKVHSAGAS